MAGSDRMIAITIGASRKSQKWKTVTKTWEEFCKRIAQPVVSVETRAEYNSMPKSEQDDLKDVGGFVGGALTGERRLGSAMLSRSLVTLDADNIPKNGTEQVLDNIRALGVRAAVYSTRKHTLDKPRLRIIIPLYEPCTPDQYAPIARLLSQWIWKDMSIFDRTTYDVARLMYYPSVCADGEFLFEEIEGNGSFMTKETVLESYEDWTDPVLWPRVPGEGERMLAQAAKRKKPSEMPGLIGAFCSVYDVPEAISEFLPHVYEKCGDGRYTYTGASTTAGAVLYNDNEFLYSNHASDPACGQLCSAFDLVRIHLFGDADTDHEKPIAQQPSMKQMLEFASDIPEVRTMRVREMFTGSVESLVPDSPEEPGEPQLDPLLWVDSLEVNSKSGKPEPTVNNFLLILNNDANLAGNLYYDEMKDAPMICKPMPWDAGKAFKPRYWDDGDEACLRHYIEKTYVLYHKQKLGDATEAYIKVNHKNFLTDYLDGLMWDGEERLDTLLVDYFGTEDNIYTREAVRKTLTGAVARAYNPGCKFDEMLIITGEQGVKKTTFFNVLGGEFYSEGLESFKGKAAAEQIQGKWIIEAGELAGMRKAEVNDIKQFLTTREDYYRGSYEKRARGRARKCIVVGTTNETNFLRDPTGARRFWPVDAFTGGKKTKDVSTDLVEERDQIWAEAKFRYLTGERLWMEGEAEILAKEAQGLHQEINPKEGVIREFVERKILKNWNDVPVSSRMMYYDGALEPGSEQVPRTRICAAEVWCECFGKDIANMKRTDALELNGILSQLEGWEKMRNPRKFGAAYGSQRGYERKKVEE